MSTRKNTDAKENIALNTMEISSLIAVSTNERSSSSRGSLNVPVDIGSVNPTSKSATAKFISRREVRFSLLRCFQNTNMVKMLPTIMKKDSKRVAQKITIIAVLDIIGSVLLQ